MLSEMVTSTAFSAVIANLSIKPLTIMNHTIKINKALQKSQIGAFNESAGAMLEYVPKAALSQLNSDALANVLDALWTACQDAKSIQEKECCDQGYIWDWNKKKMRDIA